MGSIEYGVAELHIPLILVLGHERCGAVAATVDAVESHTQAPGSIQALVEGITPAVKRVQGRPGDEVDLAIRAHVEDTVVALKTSPIIGEALAAHHLRVVGGRYDLDSGAVEITVP
jgi:carbonic anhydrase